MTDIQDMRVVFDEETGSVIHPSELQVVDVEELAKRLNVSWEDANDLFLSGDHDTLEIVKEIAVPLTL